ncbi:MAG TPA: uroporphyrinogen decarboxylase [Gemmatimonadales bacterium]|nr:uroporphyrinogen decarboxylase [Gemmatimonadales bacterium]
MAVTGLETEVPFLAAAGGRATPVTPVWFMRQAGRYMEEYRAIRAHHTLLQICARPDLAAEVTLQPVRKLGVDAAILFADILLPLVPMGLELDFVSGEGPRIANPIRLASQVDALRPVDPAADLGPVLETIRLLRRQLEPRTPLIGFVGGPFTVATYAIEGGPSRHLLESKRMMYQAPELWHRLLSALARVLADFLVAQADAGAQALQVFDSWAGQLSETDYRQYVLPHSRALFDRLATTGVPRIHFGVGTDHLLEAMTEAGGDVIGLDWRTPLDRGWTRVGQRAIQGNLDPVALFAPLPELRRRVFDVLERAGGRPGHIFNLGHGILPDTPVDRVRAVVDMVHQYHAEGENRCERR